MLRYRPELPGDGAAAAARLGVPVRSSGRPRSAAGARRRSRSSARCWPTPSTTTPSPSSPPTRATRLFAGEAAAGDAGERRRRPSRSSKTTHLIGALDLGQALDDARAAAARRATTRIWSTSAAASPPWASAAATSWLKQPARRASATSASASASAGTARFMKAAAEQTGGYFTQINPDEPIAWRAFDLLATLNTPRLLDVSVGRPARARTAFLPFVARPLGPGRGTVPPSPACRRRRRCRESVTRHRHARRQAVRARRCRCKDVPANAGYLPRTWAKLEIDRLLADERREAQGRDRRAEQGDVRDDAVHVAAGAGKRGRCTSEFKVDRGRKDHWAMYPCPTKIPVVYEPDPTQPIDVRNAPKGLKPTANQVLQTVLVRGGPQHLFEPTVRATELLGFRSCRT